MKVPPCAIFSSQRPQNTRKRIRRAQKDQKGAEIEARHAPQRGQRREGRAQGQNLLLLALERGIARQLHHQIQKRTEQAHAAGTASAARHAHHNARRQRGHPQAV